VRIIVIAVPALVACYTYRPLPTATPEPGTRVSVDLTDAGSVQLTNQLGPEVTQVQGEVLGVDSTALHLALLSTANRRGIEADWQREPVSIPTNAFGSLEQRRLSVGGTALFGGLALGGLYAMYRLLGGAGIFEGNAGHESSGGS
jgi:hypothetical protein